jgi:predicted RNase H-like HicB family nuclease
MEYQVVLEESEDGFAVSVPGLPGCHSQGGSEEEAMENISDAIREYLAVVEEHNRGKTVRRLAVEACEVPKLPGINHDRCGETRTRDETK